MSEVKTIKTAGEKVIISDPLKWDRNHNNGYYKSSGGGFEIHREENGDGWNLFYLEDNGVTFGWTNDFYYLSSAKAAAKEIQTALMH